VRILRGAAFVRDSAVRVIQEYGSTSGGEPGRVEERIGRTDGADRGQKGRRR